MIPEYFFHKSRASLPGYTGRLHHQFLTLCAVSRRKEDDRWNIKAWAGFFDKVQHQRLLILFYRYTLDCFFYNYLMYCFFIPEVRSHVVQDPL